MKKIAILGFLLSIISCLPSAFSTASASDNPKREFRGAWLHVIGQGQWKAKNPQQQRAYIVDQFDKLHDAGCNAVIFQVRPHADAVYKSELEPWSAWLTGKRGRAPQPEWDPMEFAINEAHKRGMEFHAWLNPYRVTCGPETLPEDHLSKKEPHRFFKFDNKMFFDPAYQENRDFICEVIDDIVKRYDVDAIHIDDYFYPYPSSSGAKFNCDDESYKKFGNGVNRADWRRENVNKLMKQIYSTIKKRKSWVRFGVSPFGIWRNKNSDSRGSESSGLQNYDDLYADVLTWTENKWCDYIAPQLYWTLDMKAAPSRSLAKWWNDNANGVDIYIGQDVNRTMTTADPGAKSANELGTKVRLSRELPNVQGNVWWHGYWVTDNLKGVADSLARNFQSTIALPPAYGDKSQHPEPPTNLRIVRESGKTFLQWDAPKHGSKQRATDAIRYVVYEFYPEEDYNDLSDSETIIMLTPHTSTLLGGSDDTGIKGHTFVVTSLDRMNRESVAAVLKVK